MEKLSKEQREAYSKVWNKIIAKAWTDPAFKERLMKEPQKVFKENGIELPSGMNFKIVENTDKIVYLTLPEKPDGVLDEKSLKKVEAAWNCQTACI